MRTVAPAVEICAFIAQDKHSTPGFASWKFLEALEKAFERRTAHDHWSSPSLSATTHEGFLNTALQRFDANLD